MDAVVIAQTIAFYPMVHNCGAQHRKIVTSIMETATYFDVIVTSANLFVESTYCRQASAAEAHIAPWEVEEGIASLSLIARIWRRCIGQYISFPGARTNGPLNASIFGIEYEAPDSTDRFVRVAASDSLQPRVAWNAIIIDKCHYVVSIRPGPWQ